MAIAVKRPMNGQVRDEARVVVRLSDWKTELLVNGLGLIALAAVVALGSFALSMEGRSTATSVRAYAEAQGVAYREPDFRYTRQPRLRLGGAGGNGPFDTTVAAQ